MEGRNRFHFVLTGRTDNSCYGGEGLYKGSSTDCAAHQIEPREFYDNDAQKNERKLGEDESQPTCKIIELISQYDLETQEELAEYLNNAGFKVTQATVSRDIRDLKLTKISVSGGRQKYVIHRQEEPEMNEKYIRVLRDGYVSMDKAQNILVIKTVSGMAMAVAAAVDAMKWHEVVGCIAGDDTIMCAIRTAEDTSVVMEKIRRIVSKGVQV